MAEHLALYRKWRPLIFDDVFGQEHITTALKNQVTAARTSHAYLFTGTRGTGKTTCAKILARAVCCISPKNGSPCNVCEACTAILTEATLDFTEIDAASNNGVDNIREIRDEVTFAPTVLTRRVYIIDEVHMLSSGAFNALLKTLEEPPPHVLFILATTEIHKVPATILSRCQRYDFRRIPPEIIAARLQGIANAEGISLSPDAAAQLARLGDGSMRDAISLLDRCASTGNQIDRECVSETLGIASADSVASIFTALLGSDAAKALEVFTDCYLSGRDIVSLFDELLSFCRDIYMLKATGRQEYLSGAGVDISTMTELTQTSEPATLDYFVACLSEVLVRMTRTAIRRTDAEMALLKMASRHGATQASLPPVQVQVKMPEQVSNTAPALTSAPQVQASPEPVDLPWSTEPTQAPTSTTAPPVQTAPPVSTPPKRTSAVQSGGDKQLASSFKAAVLPKIKNAAVRVYLDLATFSEDGQTLLICVSDEAQIFMKKDTVTEVLNQAAQSLGYQRVRITTPSADKPPSLNDLIKNAQNLGIEIKK